MQIKNFRIIRSLEKNTLSETFLAKHVHDNYTVKIRLYDQYNITNEEIREAILQRLRNSYQMRHRNIIATLDYGMEGRYMFQIQEHMDHGTLEDLLDKVPAVPPEITVFILQEILRGLHYAHSIGIFHGMLHPAKVLFSSSGIVKLDDFQFLDLKSTFLKQVQTRLKTKQQMYLAPEHLLGKEADHRCDLFSAGVIAYKMLTGRHPFLEEKSEWTVMQIIACNAKLIFELDPTLPAELEETIEEMIAKEPGRRTQNAEDALRCIEGYSDRFGEVKSYEILSNFMKKPGQSVDQLNSLRAEEFLQQAAQFQMQEQWEKALVAFHRARFLRPKDKNIDQEIRSLNRRLGYSNTDNETSKLFQLEQSLRANPENIQLLQRLASLAKARGDLLKCVLYHKSILRIHPQDIFSAAQIRKLLDAGDNDPVFSSNEMKWTRWQDFYRSQRKPLWHRWNWLQGNASLLAAVLVLGVLIGALHGFQILPDPFESHSLSPLPASSSPAIVMVGEKVDELCDYASELYRQGHLPEAIEILSKAPLETKGKDAARARILLASYQMEAGMLDRSLEILNEVDLGSAELEQRVSLYRHKAEVYRRQGKYGHAIDQYISMEVMPGISADHRKEALEKIQKLQEEALQSLVSEPR